MVWWAGAWFLDEPCTLQSPEEVDAPLAGIKSALSALSCACNSHAQSHLHGLDVKIDVNVFV